MRRKGSLSIRKVAVIMLGIAVVVLVYAGVSGWFDQLINQFVGSVSYQTVD